MTILRVIEPFADFSADPNGQLYTEGMLVHDSDPATARWPHRFERVEAAAQRATETAVSAPGLRRSLSKPEKPARRRPAKKAAVKPAKKPSGRKAPAKPSPAAQPAPEPASDATPDTGGSTGEKL